MKDARSISTVLRGAAGSTAASATGTRDPKDRGRPGVWSSKRGSWLAQTGLADVVAPRSPKDGS